MYHEYFVFGYDTRYKTEVPLLKVLKNKGRYRVFMLLPEPGGYTQVETNHHSRVLSNGERGVLVVESYRRRRRAGDLGVSRNYMWLQGSHKEGWCFTCGGALTFSLGGDRFQGAVSLSGPVLHHFPGILELLTGQSSSIPT